MYTTSKGNYCTFSLTNSLVFTDEVSVSGIHGEMKEPSREFDKGINRVFIQITVTCKNDYMEKILILIINLFLPPTNNSIKRAANNDYFHYELSMQIALMIDQ